jgi:hypothetical protein
MLKFQFYLGNDVIFVLSFIVALWCHNAGKQACGVYTF